MMARLLRAPKSCSLAPTAQRLALGSNRRGDFTIRFSFLPDHISLKRHGWSTLGVAILFALLLPGNREEGKGVGGLGEGTLGSLWSFPPEPREWTICANSFRVSAAMNGVFTNYPLRACAIRRRNCRLQRHNMGVRRSEGLITQESVPAARLKRLYDGEAPSSTEKLFARSDRSALNALGSNRRGDFTIRFSFLPDHISLKRHGWSTLGVAILFALLLPGNREEGKGVGGLGEGTLGS